jgi:NADPH:quinone reductase-like Zn-dependent oxidoreductase
MGGTGVSQGEAMGRIASIFSARASSAFSDKKFVQYMTRMDKQDLVMLGDLIETGKVRPVIERSCKLTEAPDALRLLNQGHARGKTVIAIE